MIISGLQKLTLLDFPGRTACTVFFGGCNFRCPFCHNASLVLGNGDRIETEEFFSFLRLRKGILDGVAITGGEPLLQVDFLIDLFTIAKAENVHTCIDSSGIAFKPDNQPFIEKLDKLMKLTDLVMLDIKHIDPEKHKELTSQPNDGILAFAEYLNEKHVDMWIRHVIVPGITDDDKYLYQLGYFIGAFTNLKALDALPYHTMGKPKYEKLGMAYKLEGIEPMDKNKLIEKKQVILDGIRKRREELNLSR